MARPRKPDAEVTPAALRKRAQRAADKARDQFYGRAEFLTPAAEDLAAPPRETARLAAVVVYVPKGDDKTIEFAAARLRKAARISEDEVPE